MIEQMCSKESFKRQQLKQLKWWIPFFLQQMKSTINRQKGNKMAHLKFHLPNHLVDDILKFGTPANVSGAPGETRHKSAVKDPAVNTQKILQFFEIQLAKNYIDNLAIDQAFAHQ